MSTDTPEAREPSVYQLRREAVARAIETWREEPDDGENPHTTPGDPMEDAVALVDSLSDEGLQILPRAAVHGKWMVLVNGQPATFPGQTRQAGPVDAEQAAEMFLIEAAKEGGTVEEITVRPATDAELVQSVWDHIGGAL